MIGDYNRMRKYFQEELKEFQINNDSIVEEKWEKLKEIIYKGKKHYIPTIKIKTTKKKDYTLPDNVKKDVRKKRRLWTRYRETNDKEVEKLFKQMRNKVKLDTKMLIQTEQQNIAKNIKTNPKKFWKYINSKIKGCNKI